MARVVRNVFDQIAKAGILLGQANPDKPVDDLVEILNSLYVTISNDVTITANEPELVVE